MKCAMCGEEVPSGSRACPKCGAPAEFAVTPPAPPPGPTSYQRPPPLPPSGDSSKAALAMTLGIVSLFFGVLAGIPAIIISRQAMREIGNSEGRLRGESQAKLGSTLGWISVAITLVLLFLIAQMF